MWPLEVDTLSAEMANNIGDIVQGTVVRIRTYGAFVKLEDGEIGLVHISEIAEEFVRSVSDFLNEGEDIMVKVLGRNNEDKLNLSLKQVLPEEVDSMRYDQEMAAVQQGLSEREEHMPQIEIKQPPEVTPRQPPALAEWMKEAKQLLDRLQRKRLKPKPSGKRPYRPRRFGRRRPR